SRELLYFFKKAFLRSAIGAVAEISCPHLHIGKLPWQHGSQGFYFTAEIEVFPVSGVEEWFYPKTVPCCKQLFVFGIPDGKGKHAIEAFQAIGSPADERCQEHLGIGGGGKRVLPLQLLSQLEVVVNFAVKSEVIPAAGIAERFIGFGGKIDNGEAVVPQGGPALVKIASRVV